MKTNVLVTMALVAGMMLAGCSKSEDNMEENNESVKNEQMISIIRQHIVGTWEPVGMYRETNGVSFTTDENLFVTMLNPNGVEGEPIKGIKGVITFNADGTFYLDVKEDDKDQHYEGNYTITDDMWRFLKITSKDPISIYIHSESPIRGMSSDYNQLFLMQNGGYTDVYKRK